MRDEAGSPGEQARAARMRQAAAMLAWVAVATGLLVLLGHLAGLGEQVGRQPASAFGVVLLGLALAVPRQLGRRGLAALSVLVLGLGLLSLVGELLHGGGPLAPVTASCFALLGTALLLLSLGRARELVAWLSAGSGVLALLGILHQACGVEAAGLALAFRPMAGLASVLLLLCSLALLARLEPHLLLSDGAGGEMARRLLPAAVILPLAVGWSCLLGQRAGAYPDDFGLLVATVMQVALFGMLVAGTTGALDLRDRALQQASRAFTATFEQAAVGIAHVSTGGEVLRCNRRFGEILGYAPEELGRTRLADLLLHESLQFRDPLEAGSREQCFLRRDGLPVWTNLTVSRVAPTVGNEYFVVVIEDASAPRKTAQELAAAQSRLRTLSEANLIGIGVIDSRGCLVEANDALLKLVRLAAQDLRGEVRWKSLLAEDCQAREERALERLAASGKAGPWEAELLPREGQPVPVLLGYSVLAHPPGVITCVLDLSEQKLLEEQLLHSQKLEILGRLAGGVAHDFNNMLTPILCYSAMLLEAVEPDSPHRDDLAEIQRAAQHAANLTQQLLAFGRKQSAQPRTLDLNQLVGELSRLLQRVLGETVRLELRLSEAACRVRMDPVQFEQVLVNLAVNARDATPDGGCVTVETGCAQLEAGATAEQPPGRYAVLTVSDTGCGMDATTRERIFEPFFTTKDHGKGTGMGLATVHGIVRQNRGYIEVRSEPGGGSTFRIYLPAVEEPVEDTLTSAPAPANQAGSGRILVVEDETSLRALVVKSLRRRGYEVLEADSGPAALELVQAGGQVDLLLTDVVMPELRGPDLAARLSELQPGLRVLYMSGYTGCEVPAGPILEKPFTPETLVARVQEALNRAPLSREAG